MPDRGGAGWTPARIPALDGARAVVTGANSGIGFHTALELARHGAAVVLACRDAGRGDEALGQVRVQAPGASVELQVLDVSDLTSVRAFVAGFAGRLDLLVNNAGVMAIPRRLSADGFELQLATNHLGHFALTGLLLPELLRGSVAGGPARVVTVSSNAHRMGRLHTDDLMGERSYTRWGAYARSKMANLLFMQELQRRADAAGARLASLAAHPGWAATNLQSAASRMTGSRLGHRLAAVGNALLAQPAELGAWPTLRAAADPAARGGQYYGPSGFAEQRGFPELVGMSPAARDGAAATWLWAESERLTGVGYSFGPA